MKNYSIDYPLSTSGRWHEVDINDWDHPNWWTHENELIQWCESMPDNLGRFSWERPLHKFLFEKEEAAMWFTMRWSS